MVSDPDEIIIDDINRPRKREAYTIVHLPADCDGKSNASNWVKVDTGAGGNNMPLRVRERQYPKQMNLNGELPGLETSTTKLTEYNGTHIPQYWAIRCLFIWRPVNGGKSRCMQTK